MHYYCDSPGKKFFNVIIVLVVVHYLHDSTEKALSNYWNYLHYSNYFNEFTYLPIFTIWTTYRTLLILLIYLIIWANAGAIDGYNDGGLRRVQTTGGSSVGPNVNHFLRNRNGTNLAKPNKFCLWHREVSGANFPPYPSNSEWFPFPQKKPTFQWAVLIRKNPQLPGGFLLFSEF